MQRTLVSVAWSNGRWRVTEAGPRNSIACFGERQDAMSYAVGLAGRTRGSSLLVRDEEQEPDLDSRDEREVVRRARPVERRATVRP